MKTKEQILKALRNSNKRLFYTDGICAFDCVNENTDLKTAPEFVKVVSYSELEKAHDLIIGLVNGLQQAATDKGRYKTNRINNTLTTFYKQIGLEK